jgi:general secretion pathway protein G
MLKRNRRAARESGLTYIELLVSIALLLIFASAVIPLARWDEKRRREVELRGTLRQIRDAIDLYKKYSDQGLITQTDVDQLGYPLDFDELVDGVEVGDPDSPTKKKIPFLRALPVDAITGEAEFGKRSYQDDWDAESWGGENLYDVYSLAPGRALDGTYYRDW